MSLTISSFNPMFKKFFLFLVALLVLALAPAFAQITDISKVDIDQIPEQQVKSYAQKYREQGYTLDQIIAEAKKRGASQKQITQLQKRLKPYFSGSTKSSGTSSSSDSKDEKVSDVSTDNSELYSQKKQISFTPADSAIFGFIFFNKENLTFTPSENLSVGDGYIIGVGDEIDIDIYGSADQSYEMTVASDGTIVIPMVGAVLVSGLTLQQARVAIKGRLKRIYSDMGGRTDASIRIGSVKPVVVNVMGEVYMPGTYTVSASATLFHLLYLSGGPNQNGSYRDVQLIRAGKIIAHFDVYDVLINGKLDSSIGLADGDVIMVPTYQKRISISGEFKRVGMFEAKEGETVEDMIRYAGGFKATALQNHIELVRMSKFATELVEVKDPAAVTMADGDKLSVPAVDIERMDNFVSIEGAVFSQGLYRFQPGMKLSDLISLAGGLREDVFTNRGVITRLKDDRTLEAINFDLKDVISGAKDVELKNCDEVVIASIDDVRVKKVVSIWGAIGNPGSFPYRENLTLGDLIVLAGGLLDKASVSTVEITRNIDPLLAEHETDKTVDLETVSIDRDLLLSDEGSNFKLLPSDVVFIRNLPTMRSNGIVMLDGEFAYIGNYQLTNNSTTVSQMIQRGGGLTAEADLDAGYLLRRITVNSVEADIRRRNSAALGDTAYYLKEREPYEHIAVNMREAVNHPGSESDVVLQSGDIIVIPQRNDMVRVSGKVQSPVSLLYKSGKNAKYYVKQAGGFASRAQKKKTYVVHANGQSVPVNHVLFFRKYPKVGPGDEVVVPEKPMSTATLPSVISVVGSVVSIAVILVTLVK